MNDADKYIRDLNEEIQNSLKLNPMGLRVADFVCVKEKDGIFKIVNFFKQKEGNKNKAYANVNPIYDSSFYKKNHLQLKRIPVSELYPTVQYIKKLESEIKRRIDVLSFL